MNYCYNNKNTIWKGTVGQNMCKSAQAIMAWIKCLFLKFCFFSDIFPLLFSIDDDNTHSRTVSASDFVKNRSSLSASYRKYPSIKQQLCGRGTDRCPDFSGLSKKKNKIMQLCAFLLNIFLSSVPFYIERGDSICVVPIYVAVFIYDANRGSNVICTTHSDYSLSFFSTTAAYTKMHLKRDSQRNMFSA